MTSVERLVLSAGGNSVVLSTKAEAAGIVSVDGGAGNDAIDASTYSSDMTVAAGNGDNLIETGSGDDDITAGTGNDTVVSGTGNDDISLTSGENLVKFAHDALTADDTVEGGTDNDTIELTSAGSVTDTAFTEVTSVEALVLADGTDHSGFENTIELGTQAQEAGIAGVVGGNNDDSFDLTSFGGGISLNAGAGEDLVKNARHDDTIDGGSGSTDTLELGAANYEVSPGVAVADANLSGVEVVNITAGSASSAIRVDLSLQDEGFLVNIQQGDQTLIGAFGNDTIHGSSGGDTIDLSAGGADIVYIDSVTDSRAADVGVWDSLNQEMVPTLDLSLIDKVTGFDWTNDKLHIEYTTNVTSITSETFSVTTDNFFASVNANVGSHFKENETNFVWIHTFVDSAESDPNDIFDAALRSFLVINTDLTSGYDPLFDTIIEFEIDDLETILIGEPIGFGLEDILSSGTPQFFAPQGDFIVNTKTGAISGDSLYTNVSQLVAGNNALTPNSDGDVEIRGYSNIGTRTISAVGEDGLVTFHFGYYDSVNDIDVGYQVGGETFIDPNSNDPFGVVKFMYFDSFIAGNGGSEVTLTDRAQNVTGGNGVDTVVVHDLGKMVGVFDGVDIVEMTGSVDFSSLNSGGHISRDNVDDGAFEVVLDLGDAGIQNIATMTLDQHQDPGLSVSDNQADVANTGRTDDRVVVLNTEINSGVINARQYVEQYVMTDFGDELRTFFDGSSVTQDVTVFGGDGNDTVTGSDGNDDITAAGVETVTTGAGDDDVTITDLVLAQKAVNVGTVDEAVLGTGELSSPTLSGADISDVMLGNGYDVVRFTTVQGVTVTVDGGIGTDTVLRERVRGYVGSC